VSKRIFGSRQTPDLHPMLTALGVQALFRQTQPLDRPSGNQVLRHNLRSILRLDMPVPDSVGVNHYRWAVLALVQAAGFIDADLAGQPRSLRQLLQLGV